MVDMLINTETDDTIMDHWPSVLPWIVSAAFCCDFILFSNTGIFGWCLIAAMMQYTALGSDLGQVLRQQHRIVRVAYRARLTKSLNSVQMDHIHEPIHFEPQ
jgi:hypothetical protein